MSYKSRKSRGKSSRDWSLLWGRSAGRCNICRRELTLVATPLSPAAAIGDAAHIIDHSEAWGRRIDISLGSETIDSYENLILLCPTDHRIIDRQPGEYTDAVLHRCKLEHELWVEQSLSKPTTRPLEIPDSSWDMLDSLSFSKSRTLWQTDQPVQISALYRPISIILSDRQLQISSLTTIPEDRVVIHGGPGSGKSTLLKRLALSEYLSKRRLPIYIELRSLRKRSIRQACQEKLSELGIDISEDGSPNSELLLWLKSGKLILLVDGFDELSDERQADIFTEIETVCGLAPKLNVVVSTRPHATIAMGASNYFRTAAVAPMTSPQISDYVAHIAVMIASQLAISPEIDASSLRDQIPPDLEDVLRSPLLLDLYIFKAIHDPGTIPHSKVALYKGIFNLLCSKHDKTKGYRRETLTKLDEADLLRVFSRTSLLTCSMGSRFSVMEFERYVKQAITESDVGTLLASHVINDIMARTGLIVRYDDSYEFTHRQLQDYHAALDVDQSPTDEKARLGNMLVSDKTTGPAHGAINLLRELAPACVRRYVELPFWKVALSHVDGAGYSESDAAVSVFGQDLWFIQLKPKQGIIHYNNGWSSFHYCHDEWIQGYSTYSQVTQFGPDENEAALLSEQRIRGGWSESFRVLHDNNALTDLDTLYRIGALSATLGKRYQDMLLVIRIRVSELEDEAKGG